MTALQPVVLTMCLSQYAPLALAAWQPEALSLCQYAPLALAALQPVAPRHGAALRLCTPLWRLGGLCPGSRPSCRQHLTLGLATADLAVGLWGPVLLHNTDLLKQLGPPS